MAKALPSRARLQELFTYEPLTGALRWKRAPPYQKRQLEGQPAGTFDKRGYVRVRVDGVRFQVHRLIWFLVHGQDPGDREIDHIDGDRSNNRLDNLRLATHGQNTHNRGPDKGRHLPKGVYSRSKRFGAQIMFNNQTQWLGTFDTPEEAHAAYCKAAKELHGSFARTAA